MSVTTARIGGSSIPVGFGPIPELTLTEVHGAPHSTGLATDSEVAAHVSALQATSTNIDLDVVEAVLAEASNCDVGTDTIVERSKEDGTQITNLHVAARTTDYSPSLGGVAGWPPAGLSFTQGTCTDQLDLLEDASVSFKPYDASGDLIASMRAARSHAF